ncbi:unnamed protein product [Urochloa humidicola]
MSSKAVFGKSSWPELLGVPAKAATAAITRDRPDVSVVVFRPGSPIAQDYNSTTPSAFASCSTTMTSSATSPSLASIAGRPPAQG